MTDACLAVRQRVPPPDWVLVALGIIAILLMATAITAAVSCGLRREDHLQTSTITAKSASTSTELAPVALPLSITQSKTTEGSQKVGGVIFVPTQTPASANIVAVSPPKKDLPTEVVLREVPVGKQTRFLNCEFQTASDLAWYYGRPFTWEEIFQYVGHDPGGNPHKGFVGRSFDDQPGQLYPLGYGVYAEPIAKAFMELGLTAEVSYNNSREWLMTQLANERPVMIWATSNMIIRPVVTWVAADGVTVKGVPGEHTYLVVGYDSQGVWLIDPWDGQRHYFDWQTFLASWELLDRMALVITDALLMPVSDR